MQHVRPPQCAQIYSVCGCVNAQCLCQRGLVLCELAQTSVALGFSDLANLRAAILFTCQFSNTAKELSSKMCGTFAACKIVKDIQKLT